MSIEVKNLSFKYNDGTPIQVVALDKINFKIETNSFVGIIGHTGSGKSTLMQTFNSLLEPSSGEILINGININESKETKKANRKKVGLIFQYPEHQLFEMTIFDDVAFGPRNMGLSEVEVKENVEQALNIVGIDESYYKKSPFDLSGGQKRKVAIAGVLAMKPEILILDEPTAGLDPKSRDELLSEIKKMNETLEMTIILVSHSMEDISKLVDKIIVLNNGRVEFDDIPEKVFSNHKRLEEIGLSVPKITILMEKLRESGFDVPENIFRIDEAIEFIYNLIR